MKRINRYRRTVAALAGVLAICSGIAEAQTNKQRVRQGTTRAESKAGMPVAAPAAGTGTTWFAQAPFGAQIFGYRNETAACVVVPPSGAYENFFTKEFLALPSTEAVEVHFNAAVNLFPDSTERLGVSLQCTVEQDTTGGGYNPPVPCSGIDADPNLAPYIAFSSSYDVWGFTQQVSYTGYVSVPKTDPPVKTRVKVDLKRWSFTASQGLVMVCNGNLRISY